MGGMGTVACAARDMGMLFARTACLGMRHLVLAAEVTTRYVDMLFAAVDTVGKVTGALGVIVRS